MAFIVIWMKTCQRPLSTPISKDTHSHKHTHTLWSVLMRSSVGEGITFSNTQASAHECRAFASVAALTRHTYVLIKLIQTLLLHQVCVSHPVSSAASLMRVAWHLFSPCVKPTCFVFKVSTWRSFLTKLDWDIWQFIAESRYYPAFLTHNFSHISVMVRECAHGVFTQELLVGLG